MDNISQWIFLIGLIVMEIIRFPHRRRNRLDMRKRRIQAMHAGRLDVTIDMLCFTGTHLIPLIYLFSPWLDYANYPLPGWAGWLGTVFMFAAIMLLWKAHADLGLNWSPTLQIVPEHKLVTNGIYAYIRHPIYAAVWLAALAQALLLANWIAGAAALLLFIPVYFTRVPKEEQMMAHYFGDEYQEYLRRTGRIFPRLMKKT